MKLLFGPYLATPIGKSRRQGFTLMEALVGLFIIGMITVYILPSINRALYLERKTQENLEQVLYLKSTMARMKGNLIDGREIETDLAKNDLFQYDYKIEESKGLRRLRVGVEDCEGKRMELEVYLK